jgi:NDP-hexose 4-ketoreductase
MRRVLVLGATGFLGRHVFRRMAQSPELAVITSGRSRLAESPWHVQIDLGRCGMETISSMLTAVMPDVVVNCAGITHGAPDTMAAGNVTATASLVEALLNSQVSIRLVHVGSAAEYGAVGKGVSITEGTRERPASTYGITKLAATRMIESARCAGLDATVLRVFSAVGPGMPMESTPFRVLEAVQGMVCGGGVAKLRLVDAVRDFVDVRDVAAAIAAAVTSPTLEWPVMNVGSGRGISLREMADLLVSIAGLPNAGDNQFASAERTADVPWQQADVTIAKRSLGWSSRIQLPTSLADLWCSAV